MTNAEIAVAFDQVADLLEFQGANPFRVRAYRNGANTIRGLPESLERVANDPDRKLTEFQGIGKDLAAGINALIVAGRLPLLEELRSANPAHRVADVAHSGFGPEARRDSVQRAEDHDA